MAARQPLQHAEGFASPHQEAKITAAKRLQQRLRDSCSDWLTQCCEGVTQQFVASAYRACVTGVYAGVPENDSTAAGSRTGAHVPFAEDLHERIFIEIVCGSSVPVDGGSSGDSGTAKHDVDVPLGGGVELTRSGLRCFQSWMRLANVRRGSACFCIVGDERLTDCSISSSTYPPSPTSTKKGSFALGAL